MQQYITSMLIACVLLKAHCRHGRSLFGLLSSVKIIFTGAENNKIYDFVTDYFKLIYD